ncbi:MAG: MipA/OmpV family protein [Alphaproteobacteria bacterium]
MKCPCAALALTAFFGLVVDDAEAQTRTNALPAEAAAAISAAVLSDEKVTRDAAFTARVTRDRMPSESIERARARASEAALVQAVVSSISRYPASTPAIISAAVGAAPAYRQSIVAQASAAFPVFADAIAEAAGQPAALPAAAVSRTAQTAAAPKIAPTTPAPAPARPAASPAPGPKAATPAPGKSRSRVSPDYLREWRVALGVGVEVRPEYPGADEAEVVPIPAIEIDWGDLLFISSDDGVGFNVLSAPKLRLALALTYVEGRDESEDRILRGLGDINDSVEFGGLIEYRFFEHWKARSRVRQDIFGGHEGMIVEAGFGYDRTFGEAFDFAARAGTTWADEDYMDSFFGIDAGQSARSGLAVFRPDAGITDVNFGGTLVYHVTANWFTKTFVDVAFLLGDAADSPLSESDTQVTGGFALGYRF